ncbi:MAG: hypothetical protein ACXWV5_00475 [Flavitalea sp.]
MNNKKILTYDDLVEERARLELVLASKRSDIKQDWQGIKQNLKPVTNVMGFVGKMSKRTRLSPVMDMGVDIIGDVLFRKILLSKADWVTRLILPVFIKNYSSSVLGNVAGVGIFSKIKNLIKQRRARKAGLHTDPLTPGTVNAESIPADQDPGVHAQSNAGTFGSSAGDISSR